MITLSVPKEPSFYEMEFDQGMEFYWEKYFSHWKGEKAIGDARPAHLVLPYVAKRIRQTVSKAKFIVIVRNPIDRIRSHWWMRSCNGMESLSFEDAIESNLLAIDAGRTFQGDEGRKVWQSRIIAPGKQRPVYLEFGHYAEQLEVYYGLFERNQFLVLFFEDLVADSIDLFRRIFLFLGVDPGITPLEEVHYNAATSRMMYAMQKLDRWLGVPKTITPEARQWMKSALAPRRKARRIGDETRKMLVEYYRPHNRAMEMLTDRDLSHWDA